MTDLSVIIPTHKRPEILRRTLEHLERQTIADRIEVVVVSDGPDADARAIMENGKWKMANSFLEIPKRQQGAARNHGAKHAKTSRILFIGDDIFLAPDVCEIHLKAQSTKLAAVLGFTTWDPACGITPVMEWLERSGWQFGYPMLERHAHDLVPTDIQHRFTYTSHISVPTEIAKKFPFREDVTLYGWEDIEWGTRLKNAGVKLFYEPNARALHHHHIEMEDSLKRMEALGKSAVVMDGMVPQLGLVPRGWKKLKYQIATMLPGMYGMHAKAFLSGIANI